MLVFLILNPSVVLNVFIKIKISLTIFNIWFGFSFFVSSSETFSVSSFKILHLFLIYSTSSLLFQHLLFQIIFCQINRCWKIKICLKQTIIYTPWLFFNKSKSIIKVLFKFFFFWFFFRFFFLFCFKYITFKWKNSFFKKNNNTFSRMKQFYCRFWDFFSLFFFYLFLVWISLAWLLTFLIYLDRPLLHLE